MKNPTKHQIEVLKALNPYLGNITYKQAAYILGTTEKSIKDTMNRLKKRCPEVYENFKNLCKNLNNGQRDMNNAITLDPKKFENLNIRRKW